MSELEVFVLIAIAISAIIHLGAAKKPPPKKDGDS